MSVFITYIRNYVRWVDKPMFMLSLLFIALLIFTNYYYGIERRISLLPVTEQVFIWYFIFLLCFTFPYLVQAAFTRFSIVYPKQFFLFLFMAPAIFAWKISVVVRFSLTSDEVANAYWNKVIYWPFKLVVVTFVLYLVWRLFHSHQPFYGLTAKNLHLGPYFGMLLVMIPLIAAAAT
ncbi:MAG: hypothetical protein M3342_24280, partial [Bacteroidota bacterium]|nr:hypothetical protein [Bacteroidota bacterium]